MKIIHIKQRHKLPFDIKTSPEFKESTVRSQFMVAQEIRKYPGCPIVAEGCSDDISDATSHLFSEVAQLVFPKGFPTNFDDLTTQQKDFLYDQGAAWVLFFLGKIPSIYKSIHKEADITLAQGVLEGFKAEKIYPSLNLEAIACSKEAAIKHFNQLDGITVILVYGYHHDFKPYCEKEEIEYETINTVLDFHLGSSLPIMTDKDKHKRHNKRHNPLTIKGPLENEQIEVTTKPASLNPPMSKPPESHPSEIKTPPISTTKKIIPQIPTQPTSKKHKLFMQHIQSMLAPAAGMIPAAGPDTFFKPFIIQTTNPELPQKHPTLEITTKENV